MKLDRIFIINLEHRKDRKQQITHELEKQKIDNYEFFKAIRPSPKEISEWDPEYCFHVLKDVHPRRFNKYQMGCLGCLKSHVEVCKLALSRNYKNILVLEDDTQFIDDFNKLYTYSSDIDNIDMLYLAGSHLGTQQSITNNIKKVVGTHTTGSYCINEKAMKYLVENIQHYKKEIDVYYAKEIQPKFNCYCVFPHITKQRDGFSDIQQTNVNYKL